MMKDWKTVKLADYYEIRSGLSKPAEEFGTGHPFLSFSNVFWNYFVPNNLTQLVNSTEKEQRTCSVKKGDVFLTRTSEKIEELGMSCVALKDYNKATFNGFTKRLRPINDSDIDPKYIGYYLRSPQFRAEITAYSTLTTRASLNNDIIGRLNILLPPFRVQRQIATILSSYDDLIENNLQRIKLLEEKAQLTYEEWFVRMKFPGHETTPINEESGLLEGWEICFASDIFNISIGKTPPRGEEIWFNQIEGAKWASIKDIRNANYFIFNTAETISYAASEKFNFNYVEKGNVILSFKLTVGLVAIANERMTTNEAIAHFNLKDSNYLKTGYIFHYLLSFNYNSLGSTSSIGTAINSKIVKRIPFILPSIEITSQFDQIVEPILSIINNLSQQVQLLREARDMLLPRLITGMIDVNKIDVKNPESAKA